MKHTTILASILTLTLSMNAAYAVSHKERLLYPQFKGLALSNEQRSELKDIASESRALLFESRPDRGEFRKEISSLMSHDIWDSELAYSIMTRKVDTRSQGRLIKASARHAAYHILSDEQKSELAVHQENTHRELPNKLEKLKSKLTKLNLSAKQRELVEDLLNTAHSSTLKFHPINLAHREAKRNVIQTKDFDESQWQQINDQYREHMIEQEVVKAKIKYDLAAILTKPQLKRVMQDLRKRAQRGLI